jgi:hypothetical protein
MCPIVPGRRGHSETGLKVLSRRNRSRISVFDLSKNNSPFPFRSIRCKLLCSTSWASMPVSALRRLIRENRRPPSVVTIAAVAVAIGLLPLPYGYYMLLRLFLCGVSLYFLTRPSGVHDTEKWVLVGLVVLYNPLAPIELGSKLLWSLINIATVVWFWKLNRRSQLSGWA